MPSLTRETVLPSEARRARRRSLGLVFVGLTVVVLAATSLVLMSSPRRCECPSPAAQRIGAARAKAIGLREAYGSWRAANGAGCPQELMELVLFTPYKDGSDSWGRDYRVDCDAAGVRVISSGPDRRFGTEDDVLADRGP